MTAARKRPWTQADDAYLRRNAKRMFAGEIAELRQRSEQDVRQRMSELGLAPLEPGAPSESKPAKAAKRAVRRTKHVDETNRRDALFVQWLAGVRAKEAVETELFESVQTFAQRFLRQIATNVPEEDFPDLEQDAALLLARNLPKFDPGRATLNTYIGIIVRSALSRYWKRRGASSRCPVEGSLQGPASLEVLLDDGGTGNVANVVEAPSDDQAAAFLEWIDPLPPLERVAFWVRFVEDRQYTEIAEQLRLSRERVRQIFDVRLAELGRYWRQADRRDDEERLGPILPKAIRGLRQPEEPNREGLSPGVDGRGGGADAPASVQADASTAAPACVQAAAEPKDPIKPRSWSREPKLTDEQAREAFLSEDTAAETAKRLGVATNTIHNVWRGQTYGRVTAGLVAPKRRLGRRPRSLDSGVRAVPVEERVGPAEAPAEASEPASPPANVSAPGVEAPARTPAFDPALRDRGPRPVCQPQIRRGAEHKHCKVDDAKAREIYVAEGTAAEVARRLDVQPRLVQRIWSRFSFASATKGLVRPEDVPQDEEPVEPEASCEEVEPEASQGLNPEASQGLDETPAYEPTRSLPLETGVLELRPSPSGSCVLAESREAGQASRIVPLPSAPALRERLGEARRRGWRIDYAGDLSRFPEWALPGERATARRDEAAA